MDFPIGIGGLLAVAAIVYAWQAVRIVRQFEKGLVETFGQYSQTVSAGLVLIFPPFQGLRKIDMREQVMDVPPQEVITKDNASVTVDAVIYFQVSDPVKVVYNVANFALAAIKLAQTNLRNIVGEMELDQTLTNSDAEYPSAGEPAMVASWSVQPSAKMPSVARESWDRF